MKERIRDSWYTLGTNNINFAQHLPTRHHMPNQFKPLNILWNIVVLCCEFLDSCDLKSVPRKRLGVRAPVRTINLWVHERIRPCLLRC